MFEPEHPQVSWHVVQVGELFYICDDAGDAIPNTWANASRIAAAPELLDALEEVLEATNETWFGNDGEPTAGIMARAYAAVAKAKGDIHVNH